MYGWENISVLDSAAPMENAELYLLKLVKQYYSGYRCLSHTCAALFKLSCWWWMCNCVCRCVSDGILEVFAQEQKEQHSVHSPLADTAPLGELEKAGASDLSQPWQWWRWLHYLLFNDLAGFAGLWRFGEVLRSDFGPAKQAGLMWECGADSEHQPCPPHGQRWPQLPFPPARGSAPRSCCCLPAPSPPARLLPPLPPTPPPPSLTGCSVPSATCDSLGNFSHAGRWLQAAQTRFLGGKEEGRE